MRSTTSLNIFAFAPNSWFGPWMNRQQILSRLGTKHHVLYSQGLVKPSWILGRKKGDERPWSIFGLVVKKDSVLVDVPSLLFLETNRFGRFGKQLKAYGLRHLKHRALQAWGNARGPLIFYSFAPRFVDYVPHLQPNVTVYHAYDCYEKQAGWNKITALKHKKMINQADIVIASSELIGEWLKKGGAREVHVVPNAVDFSLFCPPKYMSQKDIPDDLRMIPTPRIGYFGNINRKVDLDVVAELASRNPSWSFVFVGGIRNLDKKNLAALERCQKLKNVFFLGHRQYGDVPKYLWAMDVAIAIYRLDDGMWTESGYPLKLHEYLASGKPVIASPLQAVLPFKNVVGLAKTVDEWEMAIKQALSNGGQGTPEKRMWVAKQNTWDARVSEIESLIQSSLKKNH